MNPPIGELTALASGVFHARLGNGADAWVLHDGSYEAAPQADCAVNAEPSQVAAQLRKAGIPPSKLRLQVLPLLLRWQGEYVLIDPGGGTAYGPGLGRLPQRLASLGIECDEIDAVLFSHRHLDHVAGVFEPPAAGLRFRNARYLAGRTELAFWSQSKPDLDATGLSREQKEAMVSGIHLALDGLASRITRFDADDELLVGLKAIPLPGHTPGQVGFSMEISGAELVYAGDALVEPALHVPRPEWITIGDILPEQVATSRRRLLADAASRQQKLLGYHFPLPGWGSVREDESGQHIFQPDRWDWGLDREFNALT